MPRPLNLKNNTLKGINYAVDFLTETTKNLLDKKPFTYDLKDKNVIIIGGGDTANDCCATAARQNAKSVYELEITNEPPLNNTNPWPYYPNKKKTDYGVEECNALYKKDIRMYTTTIDEIVGKTHIEGVYIKNVKWELKDGKMVCQDVLDSRKYLPCDQLIIAMGFLGTSDDDCKSYELDANNYKIKLNNFKYSDNIYVCGDMKNGQSLVVLALKDGLDCAQEIIKNDK